MAEWFRHPAVALLFTSPPVPRPRFVVDTPRYGRPQAGVSVITRGLGERSNEANEANEAGDVGAGTREGAG